MTHDPQLLQQYTHARSRTALEALIRSHLDLVYSSALRQVRDPITITLSPTASITGKLFDDKGQPLADKIILWSNPIPDGTGFMVTHWNVLGGMTNTDANGTFTALGLLPGRKYNIHTGKPEPLGGTSEDQKLATLTPQSATLHDLGILHPQSSSLPRTLPADNARP